MMDISKDNTAHGDEWKSLMNYFVCMECEEEFDEKVLIECNLCKESFCIDCIRDHIKECLLAEAIDSERGE